MAVLYLTTEYYMFPYQITKVNAVPTELTPDTIYLVLEQGNLSILVSDHTGAALATPAIKADLIQGRVPSAQLPNFVDRRIDTGAFPDIGVTNVIYVAGDTQIPYIWSEGRYQALASATVSSAGITIEPTDTLVSIDLQSALTELDYKKAPINDPSFTGTVSGITPAMIGLGNVDDTSDMAKPVSLETMAMLNDLADRKADAISPTFSGWVTGIDQSMVGLDQVDNTADADKPISDATLVELNLKAPLDSPTFTGWVDGITRDMIGLSAVDDTSDLDKPISTAVQDALDLKAPLTNPVFEGVVTDTYGPLRSIPESYTSGPLRPSDVGLHRQLHSTISIDAATAWRIGNQCMLYNDTDDDVMIQTLNVTLYVGGNPSPQTSIILRPRGICMLFCPAADTYVATGQVMWI